MTRRSAALAAGMLWLAAGAGAKGADSLAADLQSLLGEAAAPLARQLEARSDPPGRAALAQAARLAAGAADPVTRDFAADATRLLLARIPAAPAEALSALWDERDPAVLRDEPTGMMLTRADLGAIAAVDPEIALESDAEALARKAWAGTEGDLLSRLFLTRAGAWRQVLDRMGDVPPEDAAALTRVFRDDAPLPAGALAAAVGSADLAGWVRGAALPLSETERAENPVIAAMFASGALAEGLVMGAAAANMSATSATITNGIEGQATLDTMIRFGQPGAW